jgi:hypothetical protein
MKPPINSINILRQIDSQMSSDITKIMARPTEKDDSAQTEDTQTARAVKGDLLMERDLIKHMKMIRSQIVNGLLTFLVKIAHLNISSCCLS